MDEEIVRGRWEGRLGGRGKGQRVGDGGVGKKWAGMQE